MKIKLSSLDCAIDIPTGASSLRVGGEQLPPAPGRPLLPHNLLQIRAILKEVICYTRQDALGRGGGSVIPEKVH